MKTAVAKIQKLLEESTSLYHSEKAVEGLLRTLLCKSIDDCLSDGIARETMENRRRLARLEGFMAALYQVLASKSESENVASELRCMLKRIKARHACFEYQIAILVADTCGEFGTASQLREVSSRRQKQMLELQVN